MYKLEPHAINIDKLEKGQVIFVRLLDLYKPVLNQTYNGLKTGVDYDIIMESLNMEERGLVGKLAYSYIDSLATMLKYDGNGVFYEYFSNKPVKYMNLQEVSSVDNFQLKKTFDDLMQYPLRISDCVDEDDAALNGLGKLVTDYSDEVKEYISEMSDPMFYDDDLVIKARADYETASGENAYREFKK